MIVHLTCASHLLGGERHEDPHAWFSIMILEVAFCALLSEREVNKRINWETSLGLQWLRLQASNVVRGMGSIPGQDIKIMV